VKVPLTAIVVPTEGKKYRCAICGWEPSMPAQGGGPDQPLLLTIMMLGSAVSGHALSHCFPNAFPE
jgi:hypothetical protein